MISYQGYLVKNSLADFSKIPPRGQAEVRKAVGQSIVQLTAPVKGFFYLIHLGEPCFDYVLMRPKLDNTAPHFNGHVTVRD